ncbi:MAG: transcriptional regulator [Acidobacteria bacterium]|nr:MAG: transcriptional regulator [Acidobacteriota bacterium]
MYQMTLRLPDELATELKEAAAANGKSLNQWATAVLEAAIDPDLAGSEAEQIRARLAKAGLLAQPSTRMKRPAPEVTQRARKKAGVGTSLSSIVVEDRR